MPTPALRRPLRDKTSKGHLPLSPDNYDVRQIDVIALICYGLHYCVPQLLLTRVSRNIAMPAYYFGSDLDPHQPLVLIRVPGNLDSVSAHILKIANFSQCGACH